MPQFLQNIDQIGRAKQRDVLGLEFSGFQGHYAANPMREKILAWLEHKGIAYLECGGYTSETRMELYQGQIYIDLPYDVADPAYLELEAYCSGLMYPDTDLGENARHGEVFDEQAKTYVFP